MRRFLAGLVCSLSVLCACGDDGGDTATETTTNNTTGQTTGSSNPTTTTPMTSTDGTGTTTAEPTTSATGGGESVMEEFGAPCMGDADCQAILGPQGVCLKDILAVYALPGGYCSKLCMLPDANTAYVKDDPMCGGPAGTYCIGADGFFEGCAVECTDNSQCPRMGYECRIMPQLGKDGDPKFCLMTEDNML